MLTLKSIEFSESRSMDLFEPQFYVAYPVTLHFVFYLFIDFVKTRNFNL